MVKEQKDIHLKEITEIMAKTTAENDELKKDLAKSKNGEGQAKLQKEKIEKKLAEACEMSNHLLNKNTELEMERKTITAQSEITIAQLLTEIEQLKKTIENAQKERSLSQKEHTDSLEKLKAGQEELT
jgi:hypothetical protein